MVVVTSFEQFRLFTQRARRPVLVNFFADDCHACRSLHPKLNKLATEHSEVLFLKVNGSCEALKPIFADCDVTKVPYFHCIRDGRVLARFSASLSPERLALLRKELRAMVRVWEDATCRV